MSEARLDRIVKGAPPQNVSVPDIGETVARRTPLDLQQNGLDDNSTDGAANLPGSAANPSDPTAILPSSPPQIYLNLLILEASLRSQYLSLRARRRTNTFFLILLTIWNVWFTFLLFIRPREDGSGMGGSVYWVVETTEKVALLGGIVTGVLVWGTGQWERGIRWPRRWVAVANRGLRGFNLKLVIVRGPWWKEMLGHLTFLFPYSSFSPSPGSSFHYVDTGRSSRREKGSHFPRTSIHTNPADKLVYRDGHRLPGGGTQEDIAPGGDHVRLLLLPKSFTPEFREQWDLYRAEYWEKENERRAELRQLVHQQQRDKAKAQRGRFWWLGFGRRHEPLPPARSGSIAAGAGRRSRQSSVSHAHHDVAARGPGHSHRLSVAATLRKRRGSNNSTASSMTSGIDMHDRDRDRDPGNRTRKQSQSRNSRSSSRSSSAHPQPFTSLASSAISDNLEELSTTTATNRTIQQSDRASRAAARKARTSSSAAGTSQAARRMTPTNSRPTTPTPLALVSDADSRAVDRGPPSPISGSGYSSAEDDSSNAGRKSDVTSGPNVRTRQRDLAMTSGDGSD